MGCASGPDRTRVPENTTNTKNTKGIPRRRRAETAKMVGRQENLYDVLPLSNLTVAGAADGVAGLTTISRNLLPRVFFQNLLRITSPYNSRRKRTARSAVYVQTATSPSSHVAILSLCAAQITSLSSTGDASMKRSQGPPSKPESWEGGYRQTPREWTGTDG